jgi:hypothetical protein
MPLLRDQAGFALITVLLGCGVVCETMLCRRQEPSLSVIVLLYRGIKRDAEEGALKKLCVDDGVW